MGVFRAIVDGLKGRKTYLSAVMLLATAVAFFFQGYDASLSVTLVSVALGLVGVRDHNERRTQAILNGLNDVRRAIADVKAKNNTAIVNDVEAIASDTEKALAAGAAK